MKRRKHLLDFSGLHPSPVFMCFPVVALIYFLLSPILEREGNFDALNARARPVH